MVITTLATIYFTINITYLPNDEIKTIGLRIPVTLQRISSLEI